MGRLATTKLSSKGQVVIPEEIREQVGMEAGDQFIVVAENDVIMLKAISKPRMSDFTGLIKKARKAAKEVGLTKDDISAAIKKSRS